MLLGGWRPACLPSHALVREIRVKSWERSSGARLRDGVLFLSFLPGSSSHGTAYACVDDTSAEVSP